MNNAPATGICPVCLLAQLLTADGLIADHERAVSHGDPHGSMYRTMIPCHGGGRPRAARPTDTRASEGVGEHQTPLGGEARRT